MCSHQIVLSSWGTSGLRVTSDASVSAFRLNPRDCQSLSLPQILLSKNTRSSSFLKAYIPLGHWTKLVTNQQISLTFNILAEMPLLSSSLRSVIGNMTCTQKLTDDWLVHRPLRSKWVTARNRAASSMLGPVVTSTWLPDPSNSETQDIDLSCLGCLLLCYVLQFFSQQTA